MSNSHECDCYGGTYCTHYHDPRKTGDTSMNESLHKVSILVERVALLTLLFEELAEFVSEVSLTDLLSAIELLRANDHAGVAGLVDHFMANAMNTFMGGDD